MTKIKALIPKEYRLSLTCPECLASFVVDSRAMMDGGRDVNCSDCKRAWEEAAEAEMKRRHREEIA